MKRYLLFLDPTEDFSLFQPVVGLALHTKWTLIIQALIEALEDAAIPKTQVSFDSWAHLFLLLFPILAFDVGLKLFEELSRYNK